MHTGLILIMLVSLVIPSGNRSDNVKTNYRVNEITRILSGDSFECKLRDYQPSEAVRFRVFIRNTEKFENTSSAKQNLKALLESSQQIELRNIAFKNYFRLEADLYLDGKVFGQIPHAAPGEPVRTSPAESIRQKGNIKSNNQPDPFPDWRQRRLSSELQLTKKHVVRYYKVALGDLISRKIDSSLLRSDTSLGEALEILTDSVNPRLPLIVLWSDLQTNALISKDSPIGIDMPERLTLRQALDSIIRSMSSTGAKLVLLSEGNVLTLGTEQTLLKNRKTQVYPIKDLLHAPSTGYLY